MDNRSFWNIIERSKAHEENQAGWLIEALCNSPFTDIIQYELHFLQAYESSYSSRLWGAAYLILGGCSDDSFDYFRAWLISQGEHVFKETMQNPDMLAKLIPKNYEGKDLIPEFEDFIHVGFQAFTRLKTGEEEDSDELYDLFLEALEQQGYKIHQQQIEFDWDNEEDLERLYPRIWKRFGKSPLGG